MVADKDVLDEAEVVADEDVLGEAKVQVRKMSWVRHKWVVRKTWQMRMK